LLSVSGVIDPRVIEDDSLIYVSVQLAEEGEATGSAADAAEVGEADAAEVGEAEVGEAERVAPAERVFEAFILSPSGTDADNGYLAYIPNSALLKGELMLKVFVAGEDGLFLVQSVMYLSQ
jgi:hypothetical protein